MKAVVKYALGKEKIELRDVEKPVAGKGDLILEVKAAGVCGSDLNFYHGIHELNPPCILGHEFAGIVHEVGEDVTDFKVGDALVSDNTGHVCGKCYLCSSGQFTLCPERLGLGYGTDGGFAKYVLIRESVLKTFKNCLMPIPEGISFEEAAILDPFANAYKSVVQEGGVMPGDDVVVFGMGALGLASIQVARAAGAINIIAVARNMNEVRFNVAKQMGATHTVATNDQDLESIVLDVTKGEKSDLVIDAAGSNAILPVVPKILRNCCKYIKIGYDHTDVGCSLDEFVNTGISIVGHFAYDYTSWRQVLKLLAAGKLDAKSMITHHLKLSEFLKAFELMDSREAIRVILYPED